MSSLSLSPTLVNPLAVVPATAVAPAAAPAAAASDDDGISFGDLLDVVNPLQHIPIVSTLYRAITGDEIKTAPKLAGDFLFGGITGFASSMADTVFTKITGHSVGDTVLAWVKDEFSPSAPAAPDTAVASAAPQSKSFGDRAIAWLENEFSSSDASDAPATAIASAAPITITAMPVASNAPALSAPAAVTPATLDAIVVPGQDALLMALSRSGVGQDVALRAAEAYRRTLNVAGTAADAALRGPLN